MENKGKPSIGSRLASNEGFISVAASLICIVLGLALGLVALAIIKQPKAEVPTHKNSRTISPRRKKLRNSEKN